MTPQELRSLEIGQLVPSNTNPRKTFDAKQDEELAESIKLQGLIEPLLVRPLAVPPPPQLQKYEVVSGHRRLKACQKLGARVVQCIIEKLSDEAVLELQLVSFLQHADIHPLDEAEAYKSLIGPKYNVAQISAKVSKPRSYVAKRLQLASLIEPAKKELRDGRISLGHAIEIARLPADRQKEALGAMFYDLMTVEELHEWIQGEILLNLDAASFPKVDPNLVPKAGACTTCPKRTGSNPDLFGDLSKKGNSCLDAACFRSKIEAFFDVKQAEAEAEGKELLRITDDYQSSVKKKALGTASYNVVAKKDATARGMYIDGRNSGQIVPIRVVGAKAEKSATGSKAVVRHLSKEELQKRYKRRLEIFGDKIEQGVRAKLYKTILLRTKWPLSRKEFNLLVPELMKRWGESPHADEQDRICDAVGIKRPTRTGWSFDFQVYLEKQLKTFSDQQAAQLALAIILDQELVHDPTAGTPEDDRLKLLLSIHKGVDRKKFEAEVAKELAPKKPKPPKVEKPATKAKRRNAGSIPVRGICRVCGCTEKSACTLRPAGSKGVRACSWTDKTQTLCDNPKCLTAAKKRKKVKKAKK
jgi:ParB family chromosome partitioning protein